MVRSFESVAAGAVPASELVSLVWKQLGSLSANKAQQISCLPKAQKQSCEMAAGGGGFVKPSKTGHPAGFLQCPDLGRIVG
jgi:hypothetical protein